MKEEKKIQAKQLHLKVEDIKTLTIDAVEKNTTFKEHAQDILSKEAESIRNKKAPN